jgi:hypothetical protein
MEKVIKELKGHSGSKIYLMQDREKVFVRKINNTERNLERLNILHSIIPVPEIYSSDCGILDMEYIHGLDMAHYLTHHNTQALSKFILDSVEKMKYDDQFSDYTDVYWKKLGVIEDWTGLPFDVQTLIDRLPKVLPKSHYHGDMTLENILYDKTNARFVFIDPLTSEYDSFVFDLAKLTQDIRCSWFIRNKNIYLDNKLLSLFDALKKEHKYIENSALTILMLLRVLPYCKEKTDKDFIMKEVYRLWM